jgi:exopolysaccharide production protein ExoQ
VAICQLLEIEVFCRIIVNVLAFLMLASVVMALAFPQYGTHQLEDGVESGHAGLWRGVFIHKNQLGAAASVSVFVFLCFPRFMSSSVVFRAVCIAAAIACLIFAQSAGSWVALCVLLLYYGLIRAVPASGNILLLVVFCVGGLAFMAFSFFSADLVAIVGRDVTLTGRTDIWRIVLDAILERPVFGFGYYAATANFIKPLLVAAVGSAAVDAHNGYLDIMLGTGTVGLITLLLCVSAVTRVGIGRAKTSNKCTRDCFMLLVSFSIASLFNSFFEVGAISGVQSLLGALMFLSLTAIPSYLQLDPGKTRSGGVSAVRQLTR